MALSRLMLKREFGCPFPADNELSFEDGESKSDKRGKAGHDNGSERLPRGSALDVINATLADLKDDPVYQVTSDNWLAAQQEPQDAVLFNPVMNPIDGLVRKVRLEGLLKHTVAVLADSSFYDRFYGMADGTPSVARLDLPPDYVRKCKICR